MTRAIFAAFVLLASTVTASFAFELERVGGDPCSGAQNLFWPSGSASVDASFLTPAQFATYATQAEQRWNQAVNSFRFESGHGNFCNPNDGVTSMGFSDKVCDGSSFGDAVSITYYQYDGRTGEFLDADVTFKSSDPNLADPALFTQIAMHELGHVLGLAHSDACGNSGRGTLMQAITIVSDPRLDRPQADDIAGARAIYPGAAVSTPTPNDGTVPPGANSCAIAPSSTRATVVFNLLLVPLIVCAQRRRRTHIRHGTQ